MNSDFKDQVARTAHQSQKFIDKKEVSEKDLKKSLNELVLLGCSGHFPLFYKSWITETYQSRHHEDLLFGLREAEKEVQKVFKKISIYKNLDRKKTYLMGLDEKERTVFIKAFLRIVESKSLDRMTSLH